MLPHNDDNVINLLPTHSQAIYRYEQAKNQLHIAYFARFPLQHASHVANPPTQADVDSHYSLSRTSTESTLYIMTPAF